jgi:hypothetical protein
MVPELGNPDPNPFEKAGPDPNLKEIQSFRFHNTAFYKQFLDILTY